MRMLLSMVVVLVPGGFPLLLVYVTGRVVYARWQKAHARANGSSVTLHDLFGDLHLKDLVREARAAL
ncbi:MULTISPECIES: hypothetical protein [Myxococcaceae]|uniref:hypothetical protein n=1 Tax=Myxococcaceae TaxID=31 RepID=UPI001E555168|nr:MULTISPECIES: hypothetical protein [Myxococcaceae]